MNAKNPLGCWDLRYLAKTFAAVLVLLGISWTVKALGLEQGTPLRYALAGLQGVAFAYTAVLTVGAVRRADELVQKIHLEAIAFSFTMTGIIVVAWSFLTKAGMPPVEWGAHTWMMMVSFWALGVILRKRHYG